MFVCIKGPTRETSANHHCQPEMNADGDLVLRGGGSQGTSSFTVLTPEETAAVVDLLSMPIIERIDAALATHAERGE